MNELRKSEKTLVFLSYIQVLVKVNQRYEYKMYEEKIQWYQMGDEIMEKKS